MGIFGKAMQTVCCICLLDRSERPLKFTKRLEGQFLATELPPHVHSQGGRFLVECQITSSYHLLHGGGPVGPSEERSIKAVCLSCHAKGWEAGALALVWQVVSSQGSLFGFSRTSQTLIGVTRVLLAVCRGQVAESGRKEADRS